MSEARLHIIMAANAWPAIRDLCRVERDLAKSRTERDIIEARKLRFLLDTVERS